MVTMDFDVAVALFASVDTCLNFSDWLDFNNILVSDVADLCIEDYAYGQVFEKR